jgi:23S rRNA (pseudouridine1915-N3)-methyltransferase
VKLRVAWFGRPGSDPCPGLVEDYRKRVSRRWPAEDLPLRTVRGGRDRDPGRARRLEAEALQAHLPAQWGLVALDEGGREVDSPGLAEMLRRYEESGASGVVFVVGSDLGLDEAVRSRADSVLALGRLTLPHQLARLVLWEQLFRSVDILSGGAYHRGDG